MTLYKVYLRIHTNYPYLRNCINIIKYIMVTGLCFILYTLTISFLFGHTIIVVSRLKVKELIYKRHSPSGHSKWNYSIKDLVCYTRDLYSFATHCVIFASAWTFCDSNKSKAFCQKSAFYLISCFVTLLNWHQINTHILVFGAPID